MTDKKYEILLDASHSKNIDGVTVHRIRALRDFPTDCSKEFWVRKGDLGGFVETEANLSQEGRCWIHDEACALGVSTVKDHGEIFGYTVLKQAFCYDRGTIFGGLHISGQINVCHGAVLMGNGDLNEPKDHIFGGMSIFEAQGGRWHVLD